MLFNTKFSKHLVNILCIIVSLCENLSWDLDILGRVFASFLLQIRLELRHANNENRKKSLVSQTLKDTKML